MRTLSLVLLMACSSNSGSGGDAGGGVDAPTGPAEACSDTVAHYCSTIQCDSTPSAARGDAALCPSNEISCLDVDIVVSTMPDAGVNLYYQGGTLIAIEEVSIIGVRCVAGPPMFSPPNCGGDQGTALPVCAHSAQ
jgi:hypothetical protein